MAQIKILPPEIRNRISAGEVVERPASIVKELLENSIDAGASSIFIDIKRAGKELVLVQDNGKGMDKEDLRLSVQSYATSKLKSLEGLFEINSLGFRGEALSSIASVSFLKITSRRKESAVANVIEVEGGKIKKETEAGHPYGTSVEVRNVFYNTPARRKFLKQDNTEFFHIVNSVTKLALGYPEIEFKLVHKGRAVLNLRPKNLKERIEELFPDLAGKLIEVESFNSLFELRAFLARPELHYPRRTKQFAFVNARVVQSGLLYHAIDESYQGLIEGRQYPAVFLYLKMNPRLVDVNVHPTKREVRFKEEKEIHDVLRGILRDELQKSGLVAGMTINQDSENKPALSYSYDSGSVGIKNSVLKELQESFPSFVEGKIQYLNYKNKYIVWLEEEGLNIVDQHAGWEKVLYERIREHLENRNLEVQKLLLPEVINLSLKETLWLRENIEIFNQLGFGIKEFGQNSFIVNTRPLFLKQSPRQIIGEVLSEIIQQGKAEDKLHKIIASLACHAAIKSGDKLSQEEVEELIKNVKKLKTPYCPHGRPVRIVLKWKDLDKQFGRK